LSKYVEKEAAAAAAVIPSTTFDAPVVDAEETTAFPDPDRGWWLLWAFKGR